MVLKTGTCQKGMALKTSIWQKRMALKASSCKQIAEELAHSEYGERVCRKNVTRIPKTAQP